MLHAGRQLLRRSMASTTHLERTKEVVRNAEVLTDAVVSKITTISPSIKFLKLNVKNDDVEKVSFKPGQWVDFHIPGLDTVGGYSMCSSPTLLHQVNELHLAVKYSDHKPAHWIHTQCKDDTKVKIKVGGDVFHDATEASNVLLIGGGIGVNPLLSIFLNHHEITSPGKVRMLYSATADDELVFKKEIDDIASCHPTDYRVSYFVTKSDGKISLTDVTYRRIGETDLKEALDGLESRDHNSFVCYLCGPPPMMSDMKTMLVNLGVNTKQIKYESWW